MAGTRITLLLYGAIGLLMLTALLELAFISATVSWLHRTAHGTLAIRTARTSAGASSAAPTFELAWKPKTLLLDQGHAANGAAGTAFVLIGLGGLLTLWLRGRSDALSSRLGAVLAPVWTALVVLSCVFTTAALAYVFAVTDAHAGQTINVSVARGLNASGAQKYPLHTWTPQGWFSAVLRLDVADGRVRSDIASHLRIMRGWQYNMIALLVASVATTALALLDAVKARRQRPEMTEYSDVKREPSEAAAAASP